MTTVEPLPPIRLAADGLLDGLSSLLQLLTRIASPTGAWTDGTYTAETALLDVLRITVAATDGADAASITRLRQQKPHTVVATHPDADRTDALQYATRQGPCLQAIERNTPVVSSNLATDARWPDLTAHAEHITTRSLLAIPLSDAGMPKAALSLHAYSPGAWTDTTPAGLTGATLAAATLTLTAVQLHTRVANLTLALDTNRGIAAACGILMNQRRCTYDDAFTALTASSQNGNIKLREIADEVLRTGHLPDTSPLSTAVPDTDPVEVTASGF